MSRPPCFDECSAFIRDQSADLGLEVHVMVCPQVVVVGPYKPFIATCPHGVRYLSEPTGEQIAQWVRDGVE